ncbi:MAG TPA: copper resistance CopC family protein [Candidatus Limnocylindrales bacterium]|nr:copper resistance CopC family protein [Candidatus Limnocylindrales bacterium]
MHRIPLLPLAFILLLTLTLATPGIVLAHELVTSSPADGETVTDPSEIVLTFDQAIGASSTFEVKDASGAVAASGGPDPANALVMRASIADLGPGEYHVEWLTLDDSGSDPHRGTFDFTIAEPTPAPPTPTPAPSDEPAAPTPEATETPTPTATPPPTGGTDGDGDATADYILPIAIAGLLVGGGLAFFLRRRPAS